jgi:S-DNA-T family DNA segregation ATPase FtsK/SpoIIIE
LEDSVAAKSTKTKTKQTKSSPHLHLLVGSIFSLLGSWILIALFTLYAKGNTNWLGPYLGNIWITSLLEFFGHLSILVFALGLVFFGIFAFTRWQKFLFLRLGGGFFLLSLCFSFLLSLRIYGAHSSSVTDGGLLGFVLSKELSSVCGSSYVLPLILGIIAIVAVLASCFGLRLKHLHFLKTFVSLLSKKVVEFYAWRKKRKEEKQLTFQNIVKEELPSKKKQKNSPAIDDVASWDQSEILIKTKPFSKPWGSELPPLSEEEIPFSEDASQIEPTREDRLEYLERILRENRDKLGDVEKRKIRDEIAELRRIRKINEWEDEQKEKPQVVGVLRKSSKEQDDEQESFVFEAEPEEEIVEESLNENEVELEGEIENAENAVEDPVETEVEYAEYEIPKMESILDSSPTQLPDYTAEELQEIASQLEMNLETYKVRGKVTNIVTGPVITRFEVEPGPGIKVAKFLSLQDDLAMALQAVSIRILAPIPGKSVVGIEIPNRKKQIIYCRDVLDSGVFVPTPDSLQVVLGKDITGHAFTMDLAKAPHLLIAGQTGAGKSVCVNVLMTSLLLSKSPDELRLLLVDPKVVELKMYESIPHLLHPVITQPDVAVQALKWMCREMDRRYEVLGRAKVRNINGFNEKLLVGEMPLDLPPEEAVRMPFIVLIIDELADLMMVAGKEVETSIARIAQKARAVGIHLVLATQRPSSQVITGLIKANLPTRIAFKVGQALDSRIILDTNGAERLLGRGDMLYRGGNDPEPIRVHGAFLSDPEAEKLANACACQNVNYPQLESFETEEEGAVELDGGPIKLGKEDPLMYEVALWAAGLGSISISNVQRTFSVGFSRAGKIVDQLEKRGICSRETKNSKKREMLMGEEEIRNLMNTPRT